MRQIMGNGPKMPLRITIVDEFKAVTLPGDELLVRQMVAACAADPVTLEDLLLASEPLRPGITRYVINSLLAFDRKHTQQWPVQLDAFQEIFEVTDSYLEQIALRGLPGGLVILDLTERLILAASPYFENEKGELKREDELPVVEGGKVTRKTVTYTLSRDWRLINTVASPEAMVKFYRSNPGTGRKPRSLFQAEARLTA